MKNIRIVKIWFGENKLYGQTEDGCILWQPLSQYPRLVHATKEERNDYEISASGIRWEKLDESVSFGSFGNEEAETTGISKILLSHPELNMSAVARRLGIQQSLLAAYLNGSKKPSKERSDEILKTIRAIGHELASV